MQKSMDPGPGQNCRPVLATQGSAPLWGVLLARVSLCSKSKHHHSVLFLPKLMDQLAMPLPGLGYTHTIPTLPEGIVGTQEVRQVFRWERAAFIRWKFEAAADAQFSHQGRSSYDIRLISHGRCRAPHVKILGRYLPASSGSSRALGRARVAIVMPTHMQIALGHGSPAHPFSPGPSPPTYYHGASAPLADSHA